MLRCSYQTRPTQNRELVRHTAGRFVRSSRQGASGDGEMNSRHQFKRQYVRLKGWLTLGSIGIMPRLLIAFASVGALAATANLIVENGVAILEQQQSVALERSELDSQQIHTLRESMDRARRAAMSAELLSALNEFDRAAQEHADTDSRASAARYLATRAALDRALGKYLEGVGPIPSPALTRAIAGHKKNADVMVSSRRVRRGLLAKYLGLITSMESRVRLSIEQSLTGFGHGSARQPLLEVRAQIDLLRATFAAPGSFDAGELDTGPLASAERALVTALTDRQAPLRRSPGTEWYAAMAGDLQALTTTRVLLFQNEERRLAAIDAFARETRDFEALLPARFSDAAIAQDPQTAAAKSAPVTEPAPNRSLVAWVSTVVLLMLFYLCFATIFSIVRPVRRLLAATHRLARGENARVVASGGIRELDTLTVAFNSMAEQLAVARDT